MSTCTLPPVKHSNTSNLFRVFIGNSSVTTGAGLTGLTYASSGLIIGVMANNDASTTYVYLTAGGTIEAISAIGTFATPTAGKCRFGEVSASYLPGWYEIQLPDAAFAFASARSLSINVSGATNARPASIVIPLVQYDPHNSVRLGLTALPNAAAEAAGGLYTRGTGAGQINQGANGRVDANVAAWAATTIPGVDTAGYPKVTVKSGTGAGEVSLTSGVASANLAQILGTALTETAGLLAGGFKKFFNVASPTGTLNSLPDAVPAANGGLATTGADGDTLETLSDQLDGVATSAAAASAAILQSTTIATLASQTEFTLTAGSADNDSYNDATVIIVDQSTATQKAVGYIADYVGSTRTVKLIEDPGIFTVATGDKVHVVHGTSPATVRVDASLTSSGGTAAHISAWLDWNGRKIAISGATCSISFQELSSDTAAFTVTESDLLGSAAIEENVFRLTKASPGFTDDRQYLVQATITHNGRVFTGTQIIPVLGGA